MVEIVKSTCQMCNRYCGIDVHIENNKMVKVEGMAEHLVSRGGICPKGLASVQYEYDPQRLTHPLKRVGERGEGKWKQISWDEALGITAENLSRIKEKYGAPAICFYKGQGGGWETNWTILRRFMNVLGSPNYSNHSQLCYIPLMMGMIHTIGGMAIPDVENTKCIVLWGFDPFTCCVANYGRRVIDAKQRGAKLIVIDPRFTPAGAKADIFVQPRPGTDGALALGMLNIIINEELYDKEFVANWTYGFDMLKKLAQEYPPERVQEITTIPVATIFELARTYGTVKPACISVGGNGLDQHTNSVQTSRVITNLIAISGNLDVQGGNVMQVPLPKTDLLFKDKLPVGLKAVDKHPLYSELWGVPGPDMLDAILNDVPYSLKALIVMGGDPARALSETERVTKAFKKLDFIAVHELFMTGTAELADIVLPASSYFESSNLLTYAYNAAPPVNCNVVGLRKKVVEPPGECHSDLELLLQLAKIMGLGKYFPWNTGEEIFEDILKPAGITIEDLIKHPEGIVKYIPPEKLFKKYEREGFVTPTKKVEFYSTLYEKYDYDPLPTFDEPAESPYSRPDLAKDYPLICGASIKPVLFTHNQYRTLPWLKRIMPEAWVEIHPLTAKKLGISDGEIVFVESPRGKIKVKAKFTQGIHLDTVYVPHGWGEPYAYGDPDNIITPSFPCEPLSGSTGNRAFLCRIIKDKGKENDKVLRVVG